MKSALNLKSVPLPIVRIGLIGLGNRGFATIKRYSQVEGARITAICDLNKKNTERALNFLQKTHLHTPREYYEENGWVNVCTDINVDLVYICTDWQSHTRIAIEAMRKGKHVAIEVPAAMSIDECWQLVETAEHTQRHCIMLENCCYDPFATMCLNMSRLGLFGEITHCEGAYIHDLRQQFNSDEAHGGYHKRWMSEYTLQHHGNPYPTHGLGPICQLLNIHRGDRLTHLVSLSSDIKYEQRGNDIAENHINNTLLHTLKGRSILIQYDVSTPRPYSRLQTICGTSGFAQKYPVMTLCFDKTDSFKNNVKEYSSETFSKPEEIENFFMHYSHPALYQIEKEGREKNVENIMNYIMDVRLIRALQKGEALDMDVYDAAEWSCITQLSQQSATQGGVPVEIPDFTRGHWNITKNFDFKYL